VIVDPKQLEGCRCVAEGKWGDAFTGEFRLDPALGGYRVWKPKCPDGSRCESVLLRGDDVRIMFGPPPKATQRTWGEAQGSLL
jgi:hypothetical protein